jgi:S-sulfo-L-cysteine synthase (O-acetyl-L-serine-dependent)
LTAVASLDVVKPIGQTPLVDLKSFSTKNVKFCVKLETHNPFGSVKDTAACWMATDAEKGILKKDKSVSIEPTYGNTGIALTGIAVSLGYKVEIVILEKVNDGTMDSIRHLDATVHETSHDLCPRVRTDTDQTIALAKPISKPRPDIYYKPNQQENDSNFLAHYESIGPRSGSRQMTRRPTFSWMRHWRDDNQLRDIHEEKTKNLSLRSAGAEELAAAGASQL